MLQSLEHEMGGVRVYETALTCALNSELKHEWQKYLEETRTHVIVLEEVCRVMNIDPAQETPGRLAVRSIGAALVQAMTATKADGDRHAAELVACESIVLAEMKITSTGSCSASAPRSSAAHKATRSRARTRPSRSRRTSTSTTPKVGAGSCGSSRSGSTRCCPRRKSARRSRRRSAPPARSRTPTRNVSRSRAQRGSAATLKKQ